MNKKQRNRKTVTQNRRNRILNKRYSSTVRGLAKLYVAKFENFKNEEDSTSKVELKNQLSSILQKFYGAMDKAVKKGIIHKNTAARKKSKFGKMYTSI
jgi:small subunit ribosomal protein S20|tara:strand:+ start:564 stop:857 length:294 start_codon:yes stop_codon:yes gene_type:complete